MKEEWEKNEMGHLYFCWPWALTSAWYLVLQVSSGYKMVVLSSAPTAPEVASDKDWRSTAISESRSSRVPRSNYYL